jgi:putative metallohydrolase (TIGR04338 family)
VAISRRVPDTQLKRLYEAEWGVFPRSLGDGATPDFRTLAQAQDYVDYVVGSSAWESLGGRACGPVRALDGRGRRSAKAFGRRDGFSEDAIALPRLYRSRPVILHELSHVAASRLHARQQGDHDVTLWERARQSHGPEFAGVMLYLVGAFLGRGTQEELRTAYEKGGVKILLRCGGCAKLLSVRSRKFCSASCRWAFHNRERARRTAPSRDKVCQVCRRWFEAGRSSAKTCSAACRQKLYRQRRR